MCVAQVAENANISTKKNKGDDDVDLDSIKISIVIPEFGPILLTDADVSNAWGEEYACRVRVVLDKYSLFFRPELGHFKGEEMGIPFHDERDVKGLKQNPYSLTYRDHAAMDGILDPLHKTGQVEKVPLDRLSSPVFVVWQYNKPRVIIDLRRVNTRIIMHIRCHDKTTSSAHLAAP